ncbi:hypothetical protein JCM8097_000275 [Rhodosporidiobolus ruineniae]
MSTSADLLSILRGEKAPPPLPTAPSAAAPSAAVVAPSGAGRPPSTSTSVYQTPLASSSASMVSAEQPPRSASDSSAALKQLLGVFGQPHPHSNNSNNGDSNGDDGHRGMPGALPSTTQPDQDKGKAKVDLLALFSSAASPSTAQQPQAQPPLKVASPVEEKSAPPMSPRGADAGELLKSLMGGDSGSGAAKAVSPPPLPTPATNGHDEKKEKDEQPGTVKPKQPPTFSFVSPFDVLEKTHAVEKAASASSSAVSSPKQRAAPASAVPSHLQLHRSVSSSSSPGAGVAASSSSEAEDVVPVLAAAGASASKAKGGAMPSIHGALEAVGGPLSPSLSSLPTSPLSPSSASASATSISSPFPATYLSAAHLSARPPAALPGWAPSGLRLPRPPAGQPQVLHVTLPDAHVESLAPSLPVTTPITLMDLLGQASGAGKTHSWAGPQRTTGLYSAGIVYAMSSSKSARVRVIERESGARALLKLGSKAPDAVVDLKVAPQEDGRGRRHVAAATREGGVVLWAVRGGFGDGEGEGKSYDRLLDVSFTATRKPVLLRFHPSYSASSSSQLLAVVFSDGSAELVDVSKATEKEGRWKGKEGEELARDFEVKVEASEPILDLSFSVDGSAFALLTSSSTSPSRAAYSLRPTASPSTVLLSGPVPLPVLPHASGSTTSAEPSTTPTEIALLSDLTSSRPSAIAISFERGTQLVVFPLRSTSDGTTLPEQAVTSLVFPLPPTLPSDNASTHFSQLSYHPPTQSLLLSSSLRGSVWAFRLAFPPLPSIPSGEGDWTDADVLEKVTARLPAEAAQPLRVDWVLETPVSPSEALLSFSTSVEPEDGTSADVEGEGADAQPPSEAVRAAGKTSFAVLVSRPGGIDLVHLAAERPREYRVPPVPVRSSSLQLDGALLSSLAHSHGRASYPSDSDEHTDHDADVPFDDQDAFERAMAAGRRMSLEGSIYVSSEVEVTVEAPGSPELAAAAAAERRRIEWEREREEREQGEVQALLARAAGVNGTATGSGGEDSATPTVAAFLQQQQDQPQPSEHPEDAQLSVDEPALGDLGTAGLPATPNVELPPLSPHAPASSLSSTSTSARPRTPSAPRLSLSPATSPAVTAGGGAGASGAFEAEVLRELRRIEQGFKGEVGRVVRGELEKHAQHLEEDRLHTSEATTAREETLLKLALHASKKDTHKLVEQAVKSQVGPVVAQAVRQEVGRAVQQVLPIELDKQLSRPEIAFPLSASIATTIAPGLERTLTTALVQSVAPAFELKLAAAVDGVVETIRQEMLDVRKEIVKEQSGAVAVLEDEVQGLRSEVGTLRAQMERMEALLLRSAGAAAVAALPPTSPRLPPAHPSHPSHPQQQRRHVSAAAAVPSTAAFSPPAQSAATLPPIPRSSTPPQRYEELFTEAMQPQHEPEFTALVHLILSSPSSRLEAVFPHGQPPRISMAVVLSLAFRLAQVLAMRDGPMDEEGRKMLAWIRRAVAVCDQNQPAEFLSMIPRILVSVVEHLVQRGRRLMALGDTKGAGEIRTVEQYARARVSLFEGVRQ